MMTSAKFWATGMKPRVGSVLPAVEKPARAKPTPGWEIVPPVSMSTMNS